MISRNDLYENQNQLCLSDEMFPKKSYNKAAYYLYTTHVSKKDIALKLGVVL